MLLFSLFMFLVLTGGSTSDADTTFEAPGFFCEDGVRLTNDYEELHLVTKEECTSSLKKFYFTKACNQITAEMIPAAYLRVTTMISNETKCFKFENPVFDTDQKHTCCTKLFPMKAYWSLVCSGAATEICTKKILMTTVNTDHVTSNDQDHWSDVMTASLNTGFSFRGHKESSSTVWGNAILDSFEQTEQSSQTECTQRIKPDDRCFTNSTFNLVVWQFNAEGPVNLYDVRGNTTVSMCLSYITTSASHIPRCLPGLCADCECITCLPQSDQRAQENLKFLGLLSSASLDGPSSPNKPLPANTEIKNKN